MVKSANLGVPRIGAKRELKKVLENYWKGNVTKTELEEQAAEIRKNNWLLQKDQEIDFIPSNDFSLYDQVLDLTATLGAIPERYGFSGDKIDLETYFAMARGIQTSGKDVVAMEMTKWFDTNYHYIVPELSSKTNFKLSSDKIFNEYIEAKNLGVETRPVIIGPVSFLLLAKTREENFSKLALLDDLLPVYKEILNKLSDLGAEFIQIDEPFLTHDINEDVLKAYSKAYNYFAKNCSNKIFLTTYFEALAENMQQVLDLPFYGLHVDLVRGKNDFKDIIELFPKDRVVSLGLVDGRNIWKSNFADITAQVDRVKKILKSENIIIAPSCSLLHTPVDLDSEEELDEKIKNWLAFAKQKLAEIAVLTKVANEDKSSVSEALALNEAANLDRKNSDLIHNKIVQERCDKVTPDMYERDTEFANRVNAQDDNLNLPKFPTTTIGSFPQTKELRAKRAQFKKGQISTDEYDDYLKEEIKEVIAFQEDIDIDVPVHGEAERNDMVEYFGEQLSGFAFTKFGWVQSYGSRCVKPPIIYGDVARPEAMTVDWTAYAQSLTKRPVKGMLTGPITILQWSFVRNDQERSDTCKQIALAIRDEVCDLEAAGIKIIQIDEPAIREGLPIRKAKWQEYLNWAVSCFKLSAAGVADKTQIHTHMCYSEFNDIIESIAAMDADVISIETSRSAMDLLDAFVNFNYPNQIGPGVYDIHSPRIPAKGEMLHLLDKALDVLDQKQIWVNPDCGLKTRGWPEVKESLTAMVEATKELRAKA